jgi:hypothetical protein
MSQFSNPMPPFKEVIMLHAIRVSVLWGSVALGLFGGASPLLAQQIGGAEQNAQAVTYDARANANPAEDLSIQQPTPGLPIDTQVRIDGANPVGVFLPIVHESVLTVSSLSYANVQDSYNPGFGAPVSKLSANFLSTNLILQKHLLKTEFVLQYAPQVAFLEGQTRYNGSTNGDVHLGWSFNVTPRLTILVKDKFVRLDTRQFFPQQVLQVYQGIGGILPYNFLENNGKYLEDAFSVVFNYKLSGRWTLTTEPLIRYLSEDNQALQFKSTGVELLENVALTYALSPRSNVSLIYNFEEGRQLTPTIVSGSYHGATLFYSRQLSRTWWFQGTVGSEAAFYGHAVPPAWYGTGSVAVVKSIDNSEIAVSADRSKLLANYLTQRLADRLDATYSLPFSRRVIWTTGVGYYTEVAGGPKTFGKYGLSKIDFHLPGRLVLSPNYMYRFQSSPTLQLTSGTHNTLVFNLSWSPLGPVGIR